MSAAHRSDGTPARSERGRAPGRGSPARLAFPHPELSLTLLRLVSRLAHREDRRPTARRLEWRDVRRGTGESRIELVAQLQGHSRHACPEQALAYENLLVSCGPENEAGVPSHCGEAKGKQVLTVTPNRDVRTAAAERVLRVIAESAARPAGEGTGGLISDRSGQTALRAFRGAVRAAKASRPRPAAGLRSRR